MSTVATVHKHQVADIFGKNFNLDAASGSGFDLAICNPPFGRRRETASLREILRAALPDDLHGSITADIGGLLQSLRYVRPNGIVAAIMPATTITGSRSGWFRNAIKSSCEVVSVTELPGGVFLSTDARTYLLILRKGGNAKATLLEQISIDGTSVKQTVKLLGLESWRVEYPAGANGSASRQTLRELGVQVCRGQISATQARAASLSHFHTSHFSEALHGRVRLPHGKVPLGLITARRGDILVARVHRRLEDKVAVVSAGVQPITDCVYRLRCPTGLSGKVWRSLRSEAGRARLAASAHGVSARHLPLHELLNTPI